jgi:hypothetical protein
LAEKYGLDLESINRYNDQALFDLMQKVKDGEDVKYLTAAPWDAPTPFMYDPPLGVAVVMVVSGRSMPSVLPLRTPNAP